MTRYLFLVFVFSAGVCIPGAEGQEGARWTLVMSELSARDLAVQLASGDLLGTGREHGVNFSVAADTVLPEGNLVLLGGAGTNRQTAALVDAGAVKLDAPGNDEGYCIRSIEENGRRIICVAGASSIGDAYGLYWLWDRIRVYDTLPEINVTRQPAFEVRMGAAWGRHGYGGSTKEQLHQALRHSTNWVAGPNVLDLVPWDAEPEARENAETREKTRELIAYAHGLHMKYFSFSNDFTYHPSLMDAEGALLSPCDPKFWDAVQAKYRMLFEALPELDGIELCNDDISGFWDNYRAYDLLHETPDCEWSYEKRFRTFVQKVHEVVADEFDKTYFHFTWGLSAHEQHVQPAVFREIFTDAVPTDNLYLMPKITTGDRWWHQAYNKTFNLTPHETVVCFETMNYYESGAARIFPTFSGQYFQAGLQTFLLPEDTNVVGVASLAGLSGDDWGTRDAYAYVLYRLMWNPNEDMESIARDFCAIHFGRDAAEGMAEIYMMTPSAYKYGLHIEPISYGQFNSFIHMRVGTFPVEGYPTIDSGREHLEFLQKIYLRCKPWQTETLDDLDHGLSVAEAMRARFEDVRGAIDDASQAREIAERLDMTRLLIATNNGYVRTMFAYFAYMEDSTVSKRAALESAYDSFVATREAFMNAPGFGYHLFGVDQLIKNASQALEDVEAAKATLANAPSRSELEQTVQAQQRRHAEVLEAYSEEAVHFAHFEAMIDGRDIINIAGDTHSIQHLRWDGPDVKAFDILTPLPRDAVTVVIKDLYSRPIHPFVLEQPSEANDYTVRIYLDDLPGGQDWVKCDLYYLAKPPEELGLRVPWQE